MKTRTTLLARFVTPLFLALFSLEAAADAFRCENRIIREGMSADEIKTICGEPDLIRETDDPVFSRLENGTLVQTGVTTTHYWFYGRGPDQFVARLTVRDSIAEQIELLNIRDIESLPDQ